MQNLFILYIEIHNCVLAYSPIYTGPLGYMFSLDPVKAHFLKVIVKILIFTVRF